MPFWQGDVFKTNGCAIKPTYGKYNLGLCLIMAVLFCFNGTTNQTNGVP
jgi:hypothetical protein